MKLYYFPYWSIKEQHGPVSIKTREETFQINKQMTYPVMKKILPKLCPFYSQGNFLSVLQYEGVVRTPCY